MKRKLLFLITTYVCFFPLIGKSQPTWINDGLVAYYPFNGNANDGSGNGHDGTTVNTTLSSDRFNQPDSCYYFNGYDSHINIGDSIPLGLPNDSMTISFWFLQLNTLGNEHPKTIIADYNGPDSLRGWGGDDYRFCWIYSGNDFLAYNNTHYPSESTIKTPTPYDNENWHFCSVTVDGIGTSKIFIDGTLKISGSYDANLNYLSNSYWRIGGHSWGGDVGIHHHIIFKGFIDDIRFFDWSLSEAQVMELYQFESSVDSDSDGYSDDVDNCPDSDLSPTIVLNGSDTQVTNELLEDGCTLSDLIHQLLQQDPTTEEIVHTLLAFKSETLISGKEMGVLLKNILNE